MALCPCDIREFPRLPDIASGLSRLPRQIGLFPDFRAAMLGAVRDHAALAEWRARDQEDFGLMLLEWWSYVSDVVAFYNAEHAQDLYLGTARDDARIRRIVGLIGYRPRPALAAEAVLAGIVAGSDPVEAPAGARFISDAIDDTPPQEFELTAATMLDPLRNSWTLAPIREDVYDPARLLLDPGSRNLAEEELFVLDTGNGRAVLRAASITPETALDGATYQRLEVTEPDDLPAGPAALSAVRLWSFTQRAPLSGAGTSTVTLHGIFPQLRQGALVIVEDTGADAPKPPELRKVESVSFDTTTTGGTTLDKVAKGGAEMIESFKATEADPAPALTLSVTKVTLDSGTSIAADQAVLHFGTVRAGRLVPPAKTRITGDLLTTDRPLAGPNDPPALDGDGEVLLKGAHDRGARIAASVDIEDSGAGHLRTTGSYAPFAGGLRTPVAIHGNLMHVTRGKSVDEVLGSGSGAPFQTFTLAKSPLTYLRDESAPFGRRSTLRLWIDGIEWREVESLFLAGPDDRVFTVTLDPDGKATITTGGDGYGRPATPGNANVYATYRFGAGDPPPGPNTIQQIAGPVPKLRRIFNPTGAFGGGEGDRPEDIRFTAPASAATFDRAISAADFAALARDWGALAAIAVTEWDPRCLCEGVVVTAIFEGEATEEAISGLESHLAARAAEALPIRVLAAVPETGDLVLNYRASPDASPADVRAALEERLLHPFTGILSPRRAAIGSAVFRSSILGAAAKVDGVETLISLTWRGTTAPLRIPIPPHGYFAPDLTLEEANG